MMISLIAAAAIQPKLVTVQATRPIPGAKALAFAASPTGSRFAATLEDGSVRIFDASTRMTLKNLGTHPQPARALAWSKDGKWIASGDDSARIFIWDVASGKKIKEVRKHTKAIQALSFSADKSTLYSTGADDTVHIWNTSTMTDKVILGKGLNFFSATTRPGGSKQYAVGTLGPGIALYDAGGNALGTFVGHGGQGVFDVAFTPDGNKMVSGGKDQNGAVWEVKGFRRVATLGGHGDWVSHCAVSPNGKLAATASTDRTIKVWRMDTYQPIATLENETSVGSPLCFTADGKFLVCVNFDDVIQINSVTPAQAGATAKAPPAKRRRRH